jgi:hypothetical protein
MSVISATRTAVELLRFSDAVVAYLTRDCDIDSLKEIAYLDGDDDVENTIKGATSPGGMVHIWTGTKAVTSRNNGIPILIRAVANLKLCVYYLKHTERVQRNPMVTAIDIELVQSYRDQQRYEASFKQTVVETMISDKDWPHTLENINEYLASQYGGTGATWDYVVRAETAVKPEAEDPVEDFNKKLTQI